MKLIIEEKQELVRTNIGIEKYEITDFSKIKFQNDFKTILTKKQLNKDFEYNRDSNTYFTESNQKSISIQTTALDKETYEIKSLKVLKN